MKRADRRAFAKIVDKIVTSKEMADMLDRTAQRSRADFEKLMAMLAYWYNFMKDACRKYDEAAVAFNLNAVVDKMVAGQMKTDPHAKDVQCRKGCSHCCHLPMHILKGEARVLLDAAQRGGVQIDQDRLQRQAGYTFKDWEQLPPADRTCVFLGPMGACSVYEARPTVCRKYLVISPAEQCDTIKFYGARVDRLAIPEAEAALSGAMTFQRHGPMANMLIEVIKDGQATILCHSLLS